MTGSRIGRLIAGEMTRVFAPYAWGDLPGFVHSSAPEQWWLDVDFCQRALTDVGGVCQADALLVPLLYEQALTTIGERAEDAADLAAVITKLGEVAPGLDLLDQMVAIGRYDIVAVLPTLEDLGEVLQGCEPEDLEDALSDLAREALNRKAAAIAVRGTESRPTVTQLTTVADYFGSQVFGITPDEGWSSPGEIPVDILGVGDPWPQARPALATTYEDITTVATAPQVRRWAANRDEP